MREKSREWGDRGIVCWRRVPSPRGRGSKTTKGLRKFPSVLQVSLAGTGGAPHGDPIDFFDFMAAKEPGEGEIKGGRSDDQDGKNEQLHQEARVDRKSGVVVSEPAGHAHDPGTQRNLWKGAEDLNGSKLPIAEAGNNKKREEINECRQGGGKRRTAVLQ